MIGFLAANRETRESMSVQISSESSHSSRHTGDISRRESAARFEAEAQVCDSSAVQKSHSGDDEQVTDSLRASRGSDAWVDVVSTTA
jgi:hypothetical protein